LHYQNSNLHKSKNVNGKPKLTNILIDSSKATYDNIFFDFKLYKQNSFDKIDLIFRSETLQKIVKIYNSLSLETHDAERFFFQEWYVHSRCRDIVFGKNDFTFYTHDADGVFFYQKGFYTYDVEGSVLIKKKCPNTNIRMNRQELWTLNSNRWVTSYCNRTEK